MEKRGFNIDQQNGGINLVPEKKPVGRPQAPEGSMGHWETEIKRRKESLVIAEKNPLGIIER